MLRYNRTSDDDIVRIDFTCRRWQAEKLERLACRFKNGNKSEFLRTLINHLDERENQDCFKLIRQAVIKLIIENTPYTQESIEKYIDSVVMRVKEKLSHYPEWEDMFSSNGKEFIEEATEFLADAFLSKQSKLKEDKKYYSNLFFNPHSRTPKWLQ